MKSFNNIHIIGTIPLHPPLFLHNNKQYINLGEVTVFK